VADAGQFTPRHLRVLGRRVLEVVAPDLADAEESACSGPRRTGVVPRRGFVPSAGRPSAHCRWARLVRLLWIARRTRRRFAERLPVEVRI
jgi:hypothetical protein